MAKPDAITELGRLPLAEEVAKLARRTTRRRVRVAVTTAEEQRAIDAVLHRRDAVIDRVPVGREVATAPGVRRDGDTIVIPVLEERVELVRRLVLVEEVHLRLQAAAETVSLPVLLRRQSVAVERLPPDTDVTGHIAEDHIPGAPRMTQHTLIALFDTHAEAERAAEALRGLNAPSANVTVHHGDAARLPEDDRAIWEEGIRRGGALLQAEVPEPGLQLAMDALEAAGAVDLDARQAAWRNEGWTGAAATPRRERRRTPPKAGAAHAADVMGEAASRPADGAEHIPLAEERLHVGKQVAQSGRVRVRTHAVETPVEQQVQLREEHVRVERHAADRPATGSDAELFRDRVIEAEESAEEAVVRKETRITGEVVVNKEATERTETVRDTVRRTEVEVDEAKAANDPSRRGGKGAA